MGERPELGSAHLPRLRRQIAGWYALSWFAGLGILLAVALLEGSERRLEQLDTELQLRATVIYGLSWIDESGAIHAELLEREPWAEDPEFPMRVLAASEEHPQLWGEPLDPKLRGELQPALEEVATGESERWLGDVAGNRVHVLPIFADESLDIRGLAVVSRDLDELRWAQWSFSGGLLGVFMGLAVLGILMARRLSSMSVAPLERLFRSRARFIAAAAHELRTPLSTLRAVAESGQAGDEDPMAALGRVAAVTCTAGRHVDTLLWYARLSSGEQDLRLERVRVDLLIERACEDFPEAQYEGEDVTAHVDGALLSVVVANLLHNAERHAGAERGAGVRIGADAQGLWVQDSGPGFSEAARAGLGRSDHPEGSGLGLVVATMVAELHGGTLVLENGPSGGARVQLRWGTDRAG